MRVIAVANQKGGSAKTTTVANLGAELAVGQRVLCVDLDPQGHLAEGFGHSHVELVPAKRDVTDVLAGDRQLADVRMSAGPNIDLVPATIRLAHLEPYLVTRTRREDILRHALRSVAGDYDICLIDCPPSLGVLTINALSAAGEVLIPMAADYLALLGVGLLLNTLEEMRAELNPTLRALGVLPTRVDRTRHARAVIDRIGREAPGLKVFSPVPEATVVKNAMAAGKPLRDFAPGHAATVAYRLLAEEIADGRP